MTNAGSERIVDLRGFGLGAATTLVLDLARQQGYEVGATSPGTYGLARTRRKIFGRHTDSIVVTIYEDRTGTRARFVGAIDEVLVKHLTAQQPAPSPAASSPTPAPPAPRFDRPPPAPAGTTRLSARPTSPISPPELPPGGLIGSVPTGTAIPSRLVDTEAGKAVDGRTIARPRVANRPGLELPDGRVVPLDGPVVVGRNPDPGRGPAGATPVVVDEPSLSKTHVAVAVAAGRLTITDLHSTNGTSVAGADGHSIPCVPDVPYETQVESVVITAGTARFKVRGA